MVFPLNRKLEMTYPKEEEGDHLGQCIYLVRTSHKPMKSQFVISKKINIAPALTQPSVQTVTVTAHSPKISKDTIPDQ